MSSRRISSRRNRTTISRRPREDEREKGDINSKSLIRFVVAFRCSFPSLQTRVGIFRRRISRRTILPRRARVSPRDTRYKYISFGYLPLLVLHVILWKVEFSETQRQGLLWLGIQPDNSNSKP